jgi:hypothetical protein
LQAALCVWFYTMGMIAAVLRRNLGYFAPIDVTFVILFVYILPLFSEIS